MVKYEPGLGYLGADGEYYATSKAAVESFSEKYGWKKPTETSEARPIGTSETRANRSEPSRQLRVFLCHATEDKPAVLELYERLHASGVDPWLDEKRLLAGQYWREEITKAIKKAHVVIVCLSTKAVTKRGYVHREIKEALDEADQQPEGAIFLIPLRLEECRVPLRLQVLHYIDYFESDGHKRLMDALRARAEWLGIALFEEPSANKGPEKSWPELGEFGERVRRAREARGLSRAELAARADISRPYLWQLEEGRSRPNLDYAIRIAQALDMTVAELLGE